LRKTEKAIATNPHQLQANTLPCPSTILLSFWL